MVHISVIIRTLGTHEKIPLLDSLLKSLSKQSYEDYELLIATETNGGVLKELTDKHILDKNTRILETGLWNRDKNVNKAIEEADGEFVVILEDELVLEKEWLEKLLNSFSRLPARVGCVGSGKVQMVQEAFHHGEGLLAKIAQTVNLLSIAQVLRRKRRTVGGGLSVGMTYGGDNVMFKRKVLLEVGMFDEDMEEPIYGDELNLAFKLYKHGYTCAINVNCKAYHFGRFVSKQLDKDERYFENCCYNDIYVCSKHLDNLGLSVFSHMLYRFIWGLAWSYRTRNLRTAITCLRGIFIGFMKGLQSTHAK